MEDEVNEVNEMNDKDNREDEENDRVDDEESNDVNYEESEESDDPEIFYADDDNEIGELQICQYSSLSLISIIFFYNRINSFYICDNDKLKSIYLEESFVSAIKVEITSKQFYFV